MTSSSAFYLSVGVARTSRRDALASKIPVGVRQSSVTVGDIALIGRMNNYHRDHTALFM
ncbi:MAG: hypothetical protein V7K92_23805 [Nostoc sp.]